MPNVIVHPPGTGTSSKSPITVNGRRYVPVPGTPQTVPDQDASILCANGWFYGSGAVGAATGTTAQRPIAPTIGQNFNDTTVGAMIFWDGIAWRHHLSGGTP